MKIYIAHSNDFDFENKLYKPLRASNLNIAHNIFLPHENGQQDNTKELMRDYDILVAEVSLPSIGEGIELGRAEAMGLPILCIYEKGSKISTSLQYTTKWFLEYVDVDDMLLKLEIFLKDLQAKKF